MLGPMNDCFLADPETCAHPVFAPEYYLGTPTYRYYCQACGRSFTEAHMNLLRSRPARRESVNREGEQSLAS